MLTPPESQNSKRQRGRRRPTGASENAGGAAAPLSGTARGAIQARTRRAGTRGKDEDVLSNHDKARLRRRSVTKPREGRRAHTRTQPHTTARGGSGDEAVMSE